MVTKQHPNIYTCLTVMAISIKYNPFYLLLNRPSERNVQHIKNGST